MAKRDKDDSGNEVSRREQKKIDETERKIEERNRADMDALERLRRAITDDDTKGR